MIVHEVRLENVKSYGSPAEVIRFRRGVNAICGANGAGKSTILEAIGCALFQYLPYPHREFVREGATTGTITVVVESRFDQRIYEVVRHVGQSSTQYVYDPDISRRVASGADEVRRWLHQHLQIDPEVDLRALFLDSVGPPQGTLTAAFLESPQERRSKFDRLLRVAEYDEAFRKLSALDSALGTEENEVRLTMARLEPQIQVRPSLEAELDAVIDRQVELSRQLSRQVAERTALEREIEEFQQAERAWRAAQAAVGLATQRQHAAAEMLRVAREAYDRALAAQQVCNANCARYEEYQAVTARLRELQADEQARRNLLSEQSKTQRELERCLGEIKRLDDQIERAEQAEREAAELRTRIPEQEAAERRLQQARDAQLEAKRIRQQLDQLTKRVERAREQQERAQYRLDQALALMPVAEELSARRRRHDELAARLAEANRAEGALKALRDSLLQTRQDIQKLQQQIADLDDQIAAVPDAGPGEKLAELESRHRAIADDRAAALSHLTHARETRLQVADGLCPFLHETCRNLRPGVTLATHFDAEIERWSTAVARLTRDAAQIERELAAAREARLKADRLPELRGQRERLVLELAASTGRADTIHQTLQDTEKLASGRAEAERAEQAARQLVEQAQQAAAALERLPELQRELAEAGEMHRSAAADLTNAQRRLEELGNAETEVAAAAAALNALNSPRERAAHLQTEADRLPGLRTERERLRRERDQVSERLASIERQLEPYRDLDQTISALQKQRDQCEAGHRAFLENRATAATLPETSRKLQEAQDASDRAIEAARDAQNALEQATAAYDAPAHQQATARRAELDTSIGELQARLEAAGQEEQRLTAELQRVQTLELELAAHQRQLDTIADQRQLARVLREAIRAAGPDITRQLLTRISRMASRINAEVLNQSGIELEWTADYEIVTKRQGETRGFAQLSGGEQMAAALAVRLAILRDLSSVRIAFLDEPTAHLDQERRANLGDQVQRLQGFEQLVVISHDDTFDGLFGHVIRIGREDGRSRVIDQG